MRKLFALLLLGLFFVPNAGAFVYRQQPNYSFRSSKKNNPQRFERAPWTSTSSRYNFRYVSTFKRTDYERWRNLEVHTPNPERVSPLNFQFCNFYSTIIGEYLPALEIANRCCSCFDGWQCQIPVTAGATKAHNCDDSWAEEQGFYDEFCVYKDSTKGELMPSREIANRCCSCYDGWKCQFSRSTSTTTGRACDPTWMETEGYFDEED